MSRPQFPVNAPASAMGQVVNGGLIDFQDNFHRGLAEYANYMAVQQQQQQSLMGGGMYPPSGAQPTSLAGYPTHLQQVQQQQASLMAFQQQQQQQQAGMATTVQSNQLPCISGPPAYVHINGQTYVPVDSPQVGKPATAQQPQAVVAVEPEPASLSNEDIDRRVYAQVEAWASRQRKPYQAAAPAAAESAGDGGRKHLKGRAAVSDEDRAAERVNSVNAGMRGGTARFYSPM